MTIITELMVSAIQHRIEVLRRVRLELVDSRHDNHRKVLAALGIIDIAIGEAKLAIDELAPPPAVDVDVEVESEDGGYEDRDPLQNAVKGDLT